MKLLDSIGLKSVNFGYIKGKKIIKNIDIDINIKDITCIIGPNGSGKTTLGKLMMGILRPDSGEIYLVGEDIAEMSLGQIGRKIGYLFQNPEKQFFSNTVEDEIKFIPEIKGLDKKYIEEKTALLLDLFQLNHIKNSFPLKLSQGEKQRLALAAILVNEPGYLILDEPTKGLDVERRKVLVQVLKKLHGEGIGMTVITHDYAFIDQISDRILKMHEGEIVEDKRNER
ncbi:MAG: ABC transporter ATP-binding protein [Clostridiales bacterium]|nr:ABC transporter ATP-binding protein [Bacillota bacterium]NLK91051.1 ABC transporter ATP-binding protein [Clostridiales bacterium]